MTLKSVLILVTATVCLPAALAEAFKIPPRSASEATAEWNCKTLCRQLATKAEYTPYFCKCIQELETDDVDLTMKKSNAEKLGVVFETRKSKTKRAAEEKPNDKIVAQRPPLRRRTQQRHSTPQQHHAPPHHAPTHHAPQHHAPQHHLPQQPHNQAARTRNRSQAQIRERQRQQRLHRAQNLKATLASRGNFGSRLTRANNTNTDAAGSKAEVPKVNAVGQENVKASRNEVEGGNEEGKLVTQPKDLPQDK